MATAAGMLSSCGTPFSTPFKGNFGARHQKRPATSAGARCAYGYGSTLSSPHSRGALMDQYRTLRIQPGASEREVKKAYRKLALQYHPDVSKGTNSAVQFHRIKEAYDTVMSSLRDGGGAAHGSYDDNEQAGAGYDPTWDLWEEWMGFEGGCTHNYASHVNPYI